MDSGPPRVDRGTWMCKIVLGNRKQYSVELHINLLLALGGWLTSFFEDPVWEWQQYHTPILDLSGVVKADHFAGLCDWLYGRPVGVAREWRHDIGPVWYPRDKYLFDVFRMAHHLMVPGLQLHVWRQIKVPLAHFGPGRNLDPSTPSDRLFQALFLEDYDQQWGGWAVRRYVMGHILYWGRPPFIVTGREGEALERLITMADRLAAATTIHEHNMETYDLETNTEHMQRIARDNVHSFGVHPREWPAQVEEMDDCNSAELVRKARQYDQWNWHWVPVSAETGVVKLALE